MIKNASMEYINEEQRTSSERLVDGDEKRLAQKPSPEFERSAFNPCPIAKKGHPK